MNHKNLAFERNLVCCGQICKLTGGTLWMAIINSILEKWYSCASAIHCAKLP